MLLINPLRVFLVSLSIRIHVVDVVERLEPLDIRFACFRLDLVNTSMVDMSWKIDGSEPGMLFTKKPIKQFLSLLLTVLLVMGNTAMINTVQAIVPTNSESDAMAAGDIRVNKHREVYELKPEGTTDVTLLVEAKGPEEQNKPVDVVITIDVSNSMDYNEQAGKTVMRMTVDAAKILINDILEANPNSRIALVRYGDFASVFNFKNPRLGWIKINEAEGDNFFSSDEVYTNDKKALLDRVELLRSNKSTGYVKTSTSNSWPSRRTADAGGTTTDAGFILTKLVAEKAAPSRARHVIFMTDGVPTSRMIGIGNQADGRHGIRSDGS